MTAPNLIASAREHDAALRRFAFEAKERTIEASAEASRRLDALAGSERAALDLMPVDAHSPWITYLPPVYFIRSSLGATLHDSQLEEGKSWAS